MAAALFRSERRVLARIDLVPEESGEELVVTDNNRPTVRIVPIREREPASVTFADVRGKVVYRDDLLEPTIDEWPES